MIRKNRNWFIIVKSNLYTRYLVVVHGQGERVLDVGVDVALVAPDHAHNGEDEEDEGEHKVCPQHPTVLLCTR